MVHARLVLLYFSFAAQETCRVLSLRHSFSKAAAADVAELEVSDAEIAGIFRGIAENRVAVKKAKSGKSGKGGKRGSGGVTGFIQKQAIKMAANHVFKKFDRDRNGHLDARELHEALASVTKWIGINPSPSMISTALHMFDCDRSGTLDKYEFYLMVRQLHFLAGGGTGKMSKLQGLTLNGCHGHPSAGMVSLGLGSGYGGYPHSHGGYMPQGAGYGYGQPQPSYGPHHGYGSNPYGPHPGYGPGY